MPGDLQRQWVYVNGIAVGRRLIVNLIPSGGATLNGVDDPVNDRVNVTVTAPSTSGYVPTSRTITTTSPLRIGGGASADLSADRTLSILQSSGAQDGYLSSADWSTFNGKQSTDAGLTSLLATDTAFGLSYPSGIATWTLLAAAGHANEFIRANATATAFEFAAALAAGAWASTGITGTASRLAGFDGGGAAAYYQIGADVQAYDADLTTLATGGTGYQVPRRNAAGTAIEWVDASTVAGTDLVLFLDSDASDIATYLILEDSASEDVETDTSAVANSGTGEVLIAAYATTPGFPNLALWTGGVWHLSLWCYVDSAVGVSEVVVRVYSRTIGGVETEIANGTTGEVNALAATQYEFEIAFPDTATAQSDRIVLKCFAKTTSVVNRTIHVVYAGASKYSHAHTSMSVPLELGSIGGTHPWVGKHTGTAGSGTLVAGIDNSGQAVELTLSSGGDQSPGDVAPGTDVRLMHGYGRWEIGVADGNTVVSYGAPSVTVVATGAVATSTITNTYYSLAFAVTNAGNTGGVRTSTATYRMGHKGKIWFRFATDASIASSHFWIGASVSLGTAATPANDTAAINYDSSIGGGLVYVASYSAATGLITRTSTGVTLATNTEYYGYVRTTASGVYGKIAVVGTALPAAETASTTNLPAVGSNMFPVMYFIRDAAGTVTYHFLRMTMEYLCV